MIGEINGRPLRFAPHALERLVEMGLDAETVRRTLATPDRCFRAPGDDHVYYMRGGLALVVDRSRGIPAVVTAMWATLDTLLDAARNDKLGAGRKLAHCTPLKRKTRRP